MHAGGNRTSAATTAGFLPPHPVTAALIALASGLVAGIVCDRYVSSTIFPLIVLAVPMAILASLRSRPRSPAATLLVCVVLGFALGGIRHARACRIVPPDDLRTWIHANRPRLLEVRGILIAREDRAVSGPLDRPTSQYIIRTRSIGGQGESFACSGDLLVQLLTEDADRCEVGSAVVLIGWIESVPDAMNPGERSPRRFWASRGVVAQADLRTRGIIRPDPQTPAVAWRIWRERFRNHARSVIRATVSGESVGLVESIVLGIRDNLSITDREAFRDSGTMHLLAISGLHLQAVALFVLLVSRRAGIRPEIAAIAVVGLTFLYAGVVTGGASVLRATVMALAVASSTVRRRSGDFRHRIVLAAFVVLLANPGDAFDPGAQLSFLGTFALVESSRRVAGLRLVRTDHDFEPRTFLEMHASKAMRSAAGDSTGILPLSRIANFMFVLGPILTILIRWLAAAALISAAVWAATAPLVAFHFGAVNPVAILANLPLVPLTSFALISGLTGLALASSGLSWPAILPLAASGRAMFICVGSLDWALRRGSGPWAIGSMTALAVVGFYALAFAAWALPATRRRCVAATRWALIAPPAFLVVACSGTNLWYARPPAYPEVEMLAVDHGLAVVVRWPDGRNWLYDCGRMGQPAVGRNIVAPALRARGVHRLEAVFVSHADADHYNGLISMIEAGIRVERLISSPRFFATSQPDTLAMLEALRSLDVDFLAVAAGAVLWQDDHGMARVLAPADSTPASAGSDNAESLVVEIASHGFRLAITGDLEGEGLRRFADRYGHRADAPPFDIITSPHHGGLASNPLWFFESLRPRLVLSSQARNRFAQSTGLNDRIQECRPNARLFTTPAEGAIRLRWSPESLRVSGFVPGSPSALLLPARSMPERGPARPAEMVLNP